MTPATAQISKKTGVCFAVVVPPVAQEPPKDGGVIFATIDLDTQVSPVGMSYDEKTGSFSQPQPAPAPQP